MLITIMEVVLMEHILPFQKMDFTALTPPATKHQATMDRFFFTSTVMNAFGQQGQKQITKKGLLILILHWS